MSEKVAFGMALKAIKGIDKVTAATLLQHFDTPEELQQSNFTMLSHMLQGTRNLDTIVPALLRAGELQAQLAVARRKVAQFGKGMGAHVPGDLLWPARLKELPAHARPFPLYSFGSMDTLSRPSVAVAIEGGTSEAAHKRALELTDKVVAKDLVLMVGVETDIDAALGTRHSRKPLVLVTGRSFSKIDQRFRPIVKSAETAGGVLLSPFPLDHRPASHDDHDRVMLMAGLSTVTVFIEPRRGAASRKAMDWCCTQGKSVFALPLEGDPVPERVHAITSEIDLDWVVYAAGLNAPQPA